MACHRQYRRPTKAFTLIEILVVFSILSCIIAGGLWISFGAYLSTEHAYEKVNLVSLLEESRSNSITNSETESTSTISFSEDGNSSASTTIQSSDSNVRPIFIYSNGEIDY